MARVDARNDQRAEVDGRMARLMTPEYLEELADLADPEQLWKLPVFDQLDLSQEKRHQLDAGVALRRHADHVRRLRELLGTGQSLLITPLSPSGTATKKVPIPESHVRLLPKERKTPNVAIQPPAGSAGIAG